jgi:hypothetical protein
MNKNFMIGFMYEGYFYCANVHRYHTSSLEYHITILANRLKEGMPDRIILKDGGPGYRQALPDGVSGALLNTIVEEIQKHS